MSSTRVLARTQSGGVAHTGRDASQIAIAADSPDSLHITLRLHYSGKYDGALWVHGPYIQPMRSSFITLLSLPRHVRQHQRATEPASSGSGGGVSSTVTARPSEQEYVKSVAAMLIDASSAQQALGPRAAPLHFAVHWRTLQPSSLLGTLGIDVTPLSTLYLHPTQRHVSRGCIIACAYKYATSLSRLFVGYQNAITRPREKKYCAV